MPIDAIVQLMNTCENMAGCMDYVKPWLSFARASTASAQWAKNIGEMVENSTCSSAELAAAEPAPAPAWTPEPAPAPEAAAPAAKVDRGDLLSMHLIPNCDTCKNSWCEKAEQGKCINFLLNDGMHVLGPRVDKIGCDALTSRTPYCVEGSNNLYALGKTTKASKKRRDKTFDSANCESASHAADNAWCIATCTTISCSGNKGMCKCGATGTKGRRRMELQPNANDGQWHPEGTVAP